MTAPDEFLSMLHSNRPVSRTAALALGLAALALALAILGVYSPWGALRYPVAPKLQGNSAILGYGGTCVLPMLIGMGAALLGGHAFRKIEQAQGKVGGDGLAFFSLMIGLFAVVIGACTTFATLIWPNL